MIIGVVMICLVLTSCCALKKTNENTGQYKHPFKMISATYSSKQAEQVFANEFQLRFTIDNQEIQLDSVYFRNTAAGLKRDTTSSNALFVANILLPDSKKDYNLHSDPQKEFGNTPPGTPSKIPFEIHKNEAVVSYSINGETHYYIIENVVEMVPGNY